MQTAGYLTAPAVLVPRRWQRVAKIRNTYLAERKTAARDNGGPGNPEPASPNRALDTPLPFTNPGLVAVYNTVPTQGSLFHLSSYGGQVLDLADVDLYPGAHRR